MTLSCKSAINQTSLSHYFPSSSPQRTRKVQVKENSTLKTTILIISLPVHCICFCLFILLSTEDEDEEDTEIRIVKRVEDYYPENKFTARYIEMKETLSLIC